MDVRRRCGATATAAVLASYYEAYSNRSLLVCPDHDSDDARRDKVDTAIRHWT